MANEFTVKSWRGNINVVEHDDGGMWDLFDESDGNCLNGVRKEECRPSGQAAMAMPAPEGLQAKRRRR